MLEPPKKTLKIFVAGIAVRKVALTKTQINIYGATEYRHKKYGPEKYFHIIPPSPKIHTKSKTARQERLLMEFQKNYLDEMSLFKRSKNFEA